MGFAQSLGAHIQHGQSEGGLFLLSLFPRSCKPFAEPSARLELIDPSAD